MASLGNSNEHSTKKQYYFYINMSNSRKGEHTFHNTIPHIWYLKRNLLSHISGCQKFKIKILSVLVSSGKEFIPCLSVGCYWPQLFFVNGILSLSSHHFPSISICLCVQTSLSYQDFNSIVLGCTLITSLDQICKGFFPQIRPHSVALGIRISAFEFRRLQFSP